MATKQLWLGLLALVLLVCPPACAGDNGGKTTGTGNGGDNASTPTRDGAASAARIILHTSDGNIIVGSFVGAQAEAASPACLLVHQLGKDRGTYSQFQRRLAEMRISSLAIDLRGHGESTNNGTVYFRNFTKDEEWAGMVNDFKAALDYLRSQPRIDPSRIGIVGASIGANLAVIAAADEVTGQVENPAMCLVLLSPGANYHGIRPVPRARELGDMPVLVVSAKADGQSYSGSEAISQAAPGGEFRSLNGRAHGTDMFEIDPNLMGEVIDWLHRHLTAARDESASEAPAENPPAQEDES